MILGAAGVLITAPRRRKSPASPGAPARPVHDHALSPDRNTIPVNFEEPQMRLRMRPGRRGPATARGCLPSHHRRLAYGLSGLAVNEYGVAADLFGERTAGTENHGDALRVPGGWRTQLACHGEQAAASVV